MASRSLAILICPSRRLPVAETSPSNAIAWDPLTDEYLDPCDGQTDLARLVLRAVDPSTFGDDSLRVLRAVQFAARFTFEVDEAHEDALSRHRAR